MKKNKVIVAIDNNNLKESKELILHLKEDAFAFKIGYEFFFNFGIEGFKKIVPDSTKIFIDLKLHDIPNTVAQGIHAINKLNPYFTTIHLSGGDEMQKAAYFSKGKVKLLGVSILTSIDNEQAKKYYFNKNIDEIITNFANYALFNQLDGIVCSPKEIRIIKKIVSNKMLIITPGIRTKKFNISNDDQKRTMTPKEAIEEGANYLVIGRPITQSQDPLKTLKEINSSIA